MAKKFNLYCNLKKVGTLEFEGDSSQTTLIYDEKWTADKNAFDILPTIKKDQAIHTGTQVYNYFENLLPEDEEHKEANIQERGLEDLLTIHGNDAAGAIDIYSEDYDVSTIDLKSVKNFASKEIEKIFKNSKRPIKDLENIIGKKFSIAGAQSKFTCLWDGKNFNFPNKGGATTHIVKPIPYENRNLTEAQKKLTPHNEFLTMSIAAKIWKDTPKAELIVLDGVKLYAVERFDRVIGENGIIEKIHQADFCQIAGRLSQDKYEIPQTKTAKPGITLKDIDQYIGDYSSNPIEDRERLYEWIAFNLITKNTDSHSKNISMMLRPEDYRVAPMYDLLCMEPYTGLETTFAFKIGDKIKIEQITVKNVRQLEETIGVGKDFLVNKVIEMQRKIMSALNAVDTDVQKMNIDPTDLKVMNNCLSKTWDAFNRFEKSFYINYPKDIKAFTVCKKCSTSVSGVNSVVGICSNCKKKI